MQKIISSKITVKTVILILAMSSLLSIAPQTAEASFVPSTSTFRLGLFFGSTALPSANLQNVDGMGRGYEFGYYDSNRNFVSVGAWTDETRITMTMDRNMVWHPGEDGGWGEYREGTSGSVVIGAFHVQLNAGYGTFEEARAIAANYTGGFVRYENGTFLVLVGHHTSRAAAESAMAALGVSGAAINSGTSNTITVTRTGSSTIIFEFEHGTSRHLGVIPRPVGNENPETWFRGYTYNGGFQYARREGALLSVTHFVSVEDYIKGILPYEMNNTWPLEALKAQAMCARTYAMSYVNRHGSSGFDLCVEVHCQVYRGRNRANERTDRAVEETAGMYITYDGALTRTYYASSNGGASENSENVWFDTLPYLRGVIDPYEADVANRIPNYNWTRTFTPAEITQRLQNRGHNVSTIVSMRVSEYTPTGNVLSVTLTDTNGRRVVLSRREGTNGLNTVLGTPTQRFYIGDSRPGGGGVFINESGHSVGSGDSLSIIDGNGNIISVPGGSLHAITGSGSVELVTGSAGGSSGGSNDTGLVNGVFTIRGTGSGHNVGMSQWGAYSMAEYHGKTFEEIILFYFTGVEITRTA